MARCVEVYVYTWLGVRVHLAAKGRRVNDIVTQATNTDLTVNTG